MHEIKILSIQEEKEKTVVFVELTKAFKTYFVETHGLKKWSHMKFQRVFLDALCDMGLEVSKGKVKVSVT